MGQPSSTIASPEKSALALKHLNAAKKSGYRQTEVEKADWVILSEIHEGRVWTYLPTQNSVVLHSEGMDSHALNQLETSASDCFFFSDWLFRKEVAFVERILWKNVPPASRRFSGKIEIILKFPELSLVQAMYHHRAYYRSLYWLTEGFLLLDRFGIPTDLLRKEGCTNDRLEILSDTDSVHASCRLERSSEPLVEIVVSKKNMEITASMGAQNHSVTVRQHGVQKTFDVQDNETRLADYYTFLESKERSTVAHIVGLEKLRQAVSSAEKILNQCSLVEDRRLKSSVSSESGSPGVNLVRKHPPLGFISKESYADQFENIRIDGFRLLLIRSPNEGIEKSSQRLLPYSISRLAGFLQKHGADVKLIDTNAFSSGHIAKKTQKVTKLVRELVRSHPFDLIGVSVDRPEDFSDAAWMISELKRIFATPIVVGGRGTGQSSPKGESAMDYIISGEGEVPLLLLCDALATKKEVSPAIPGLSSCLPGGFLERLLVEHDLSVFPTPDFKDLVAAYGKPESLWFPYTFFCGCPFACAYCSSFSDRRFHVCEPDKVIHDLATIHKKYGLRKIYFLNNLINYRTDFILNRLSSWINSGPKMIWGDSARPQKIPHGLFGKLRKAGCRYLVWGVDAGSDRMQKKMNKNLDLEETIAILKRSSHARIENKVNIVCGLPGETAQDLQETLSYLERIAPYTSEVLLSKYVFAQCSPIFNRPEAYDVMKRGDTFDEIDGLPWEEKNRQIQSHYEIIKTRLSEIGL